MNTWRDIKTAPKHQPVLVTVEGMICFGRFCDFEDEDYSGLAFDGACLNDGESVSYFADYIDGWQPAPATFQPEQSADQMFAGIGYKQRHVPESVERWTARMYENESGSMRIEIQYSGFVEARDNNEICGMTAKEILACAQLIKEMEANNG